MGWRGTAVLAVALLGAAVYLYRDVTGQHPDASWQHLLEEPRPAAPGTQIKRLLAFDPGAATSVRLRRGDEVWTAQRTGNAWQGAARPSDVDDFLHALQELAEILPIEAAKNELHAHGLDPPASVVEVERSDGPPLVLLIGHRNPPATGVYVQIGSDGPVVLTGALLLWEFDKATRSFASG
jgi:hypothetical protein